ncbi:pilus assembly PilX N-terminal domain-containing protein [Motilimonas sp. 1_MG-2023]|uniref:pilus assembly PilX N-terminal domain-containing protein n=1 Tax=Motilimonas sp. 1_MG-2023 TaxID=3062672 RepID=UPI0026E2EE04|nr:pilus assembly PilX N-terminal domain-containing protein [Motilimonas sp. 1_MG-2023]MDO6526669.1 pilus assembly PilX N-terminal domain-containing protein [Motilimonas sp. 1_MG-2023]
MMKLKHRQNKQAGLAMLTVTLLLLISATSFTFFSVKSRLMEAKISSNDYRYRETFVNAEAGLEHAISFLSSKGWKTSTPGLAGTLNASGNNVYNLSKVDVYDVEIIEECADCGLVTVNSTGKGDSGLLTRTISRIAVYPPERRAIVSPLIAAGASSLYGSVNINAALPGKEAAPSAVQVGGADFGTDGSLNTNLKDVVKNPALRGDNLYAYLGVPETDWKELRDNSEITVHITGCTNLPQAISDAGSTKIIWVTGECNVPTGFGTIGTESNPIMLVVQDGNVNGNFSLNGLLYAFNSDSTNPSRKLARFGAEVTGNIYGAFIVDYKYAFRYTASLVVNYRRDLLDGLPDPGELLGKKAYWVPGGWSDIDA